MTTAAATLDGPRMSELTWPRLSSMITNRNSTITAPA